jgi:hypothetical protein
MTPEQAALQFRSSLSRLLKSFAQKAPHIFHAYVERHFDTGGNVDPASVTWSKSTRLAARSGKLARSFIPGQEGNLWKVTVDDSGLTIRLGSSLKYASIHEGKKGEKVFISTKGRMHLYFWAMYAKTKNPFFRIMALSVKKKGGVTIEKRPYFAEAVQQFHEQEIPRLAADIFATLKQSFALQ